MTGKTETMVGTMKKIPGMLRRGTLRRFDNRSVRSVLVVAGAAALTLFFATLLLADMGVPPLVMIALGQGLIIVLTAVESSRLEKACVTRAEQMSSPTRGFFAPKVKFSGAMIGSAAGAVASNAAALLGTDEGYPILAFTGVTLLMLAIIALQSLEMIRDLGHLTDDEGKSLVEVLA